VVVWRIGDEDTLAANLQNTAIAIKSTVSPTNQSTKYESSSAVSGKIRSGSRGNRDSDTSRARALSSGIAHDDHELEDSDDENDKNDRANRSDTESALSERTSKTAVKKNVFKIDIRKIPGVDILADGAMISYLKIVAEINRSAAVLRYRTDQRLQAIHDESAHVVLPKTPRPISPDHQYSEEPSKFKVRMGFGLHAGWGIEGAVGSMYKVDATYLSPHVNMAARLETASKQYKVPLLMSHVFHELLSDVVKTKTRQIDTVTVKGSEVPIGIFTYDCLQDQEFTKRTKSDVQLYDGASRKKADSQNSTSTAMESQLTDELVAPVTIESASIQPPPVTIMSSRPSYETIPVRRPSLIVEEEEEDGNGLINQVLQNGHTQRTPFSTSFSSTSTTPASALQSRPRLYSDNPPRMSTTPLFAQQLRPRLSSDNPPRMSTFGESPPIGSPVLNVSKKIVITSLPRNSPSMRASMMTSKPDVRRRSFVIEEELREEHHGDSSQASAEVVMDAIYYGGGETAKFSTPNIAFSPRTSSSSMKSKGSFDSASSLLPPSPPPPSAATPTAILRLSTGGESGSTEPKRRVSGVTYNLVPTVINIDYSHTRDQNDDKDEDDSEASKRQLALDYPNNLSESNAESKSGLPSSPFMPISPPSNAVNTAPKKTTLLEKLFPPIIEPPRFAPGPITTVMASKETVQKFKMGAAASPTAKLPELSLSSSAAASNPKRVSIGSSSSEASENESSGSSNPLAQFLTPADSIEEIMNSDTDIVKLRRHITVEFMDTFQEGFKHYIQGDWPRARVYFERSNELMATAAPSLGGDGPSQTLLNYMKSLEFKAPKGWNGYRALTNK
jgi:hypothetical protein